MSGASTTTFYIRDASGNTMATYKLEKDDPSSISSNMLKEFIIYGSSCLGVLKIDEEVVDLPNVRITTTGTQISNEKGKHYYELSNHLGNVLSVVSDRKQGSTEARIENLVNIEQQADGTLKNTNTANGWTNGAASEYLGTGDCSVEHIVKDENGDGNISENHYIMVGLSYNDVNVDYHTIDYCLYTYSGNRLYVFEQGSNILYYGTVVDGDILKVERIGNQIKYYKNSTLLRTVTQSSTDANMLADISMYKVGTYIYDLSCTGSDIYYHPDIVSANDYYPFGMAMPGRTFSSPAYRYGFNGKEKDDEMGKGDGNSYDFGARIYDVRLGRFLSVDPKYKLYPFMASYCYAANNPIVYVDYEGEGPIITLARILLYPYMKLTSWTGISVMVQESASASAGIAVLVGAGGTVAKGYMLDQNGNIGMILSAGAFCDLASAFGGVAYKGVEETGNFSLGAEASLKYGISFHNINSILDMGGYKNGTSGIDIDAGAIVSGGFNLSENSIGISFGLGLGAAISQLGADNFVLATNLNDLEQFEDAGIAAFDYANENGGNVSLDYKTEGNVTSVTFNVTTTNKEGKEIVKKFEAITLTVDKKRNAVYTNTVNDNDE